ncbi:MAG: hypothetical protein V4633_22900 [Pseudomonadota bacterium]
MNIVKNMEVVFIAALALAAVTGFATAKVNAPRAATISTAAAPIMEGDIATVVVTAKRLTAAEKARLGS